MARIRTLMGAVEDLDDDQSAEDTAGDIDTEMPGEVRDAEDEVDEGEKVLDDSADDAETLENVKAILEEAADKGTGLPDVAAEIVEATTEAIYARLGIKGSPVIESVEAFSNERTRVTATRMAIESIGDTIDRVWEAIKKFFKDLWDKIKDLWKTYVTAVGRLKLKAKALRKKIGSVGSEKKNDSFTDKSMAKKVLNSKGTQVNITAQIETTVNALGVNRMIKTAILATVEAVEKADSTNEKAVEDAKKKLREIVSRYAHNSQSFAKVNHYDLADDDVMVGNKGVAVYIDDAGGDDKDSKFTLDVFVANAETSKDADEITVGSKVELSKYCEGVIKICGIIETERDKDDKDDKKVMKALDRLSKKSNKDTVKENGKDRNNRKDAALMREILRANGKMQYMPAKVAISGCHDVLAYVNRCLREYEK